MVPAHNEREHIAGVLKSIPEYVDYIIVVDDASTDGTWDVARQVAETRVEIIRHARNEGVGAAVVTGHRRALELGADVSAVMAGDGQMDPAYLPSLLDAVVVDGYDYAKGNRFITRGTLRGMPGRRLWGNAALTVMTKFASGYWHIFDTQNGYTAISSEALRSIPLDRLRRDYVFENSLLCELNLSNLRVRDVPIPALYRDEKSGIRVGRFFFAASPYLVRAFWRRIFLRFVLRDFHPVALFYFVGALLALWGFAFGLVVVYWSLGPASASTGTVMLSVLPFFIGVQLLLTAVTIDIFIAPR